MANSIPSVTKAKNLGDLLKFEAPNLYSRERTTVVAGQTLELGAVVGTVTATGKTTRFDPEATDGSQVPTGVLLADCDASLIDRDDGLIAARHAIVADGTLIWPVGIAPADKAAAIATLKALGVLIRQSA